MNRILLIVAAVVVLGAGAWAFVNFTGDDNSSDSADSVNQEQTNNNGDTDFNDIGLDDQPFEAVITGTQDSKEYQITMQSDGQGRMRLFGEGNEGDEFETVYTAEAYYSCSAGQCIKFPVSQNDDSAFEPSDYIYDDNELGDLGENANYIGKRDCPAGQCDAWEVTEDGYKSTLYLDSNDRINQVISNTEEGEAKIVYTFKPVTIKVPANAQEIPALQP